MSQSSYRIRHGMTLVELMVVLSIATLIAALVLPTVKSILTNRKTSQSAIVIKNYLEAARARAIGKNRSVAVVLERVSSRAMLEAGTGVYVSSTASRFPAANRTSFPADTNFIPYNTCVKLSLAEEPLPVTEQMIPTGCFFTPVASNNGSIPQNYDPPLLDADQILQASPEVRVFSVTTSTGIAAQWLGEYLVAGNEVSIGDSPRRFTICSPASRVSHDNYAATNPSTIYFSVINELGLDGLGELAMRPYVDLPTTTSYAEFKIFQKPKPIYSQAIQLPKGTCIDLSLSGFANDMPGLSDYRVRFASDWVRTGADGIPTPEELRPVYLVFSPEGSFYRVYANQQSSPTVTGAQLTRIETADDVFLHVGRIDQVVMPVDTSTNSRTLSSFTAAVSSGVKQNLTDPSSYVIRLSPRSGAITAAPIGLFVPEATDSLGDIIKKTRLGTYNSTLTGQ